MTQIGDYQRAVDVLAPPEPFSDDDLNILADKWEKDNGAPLIRRHEEDAEGHPNETFLQRVAKFRFHPGKGGLVADPEIHRRELRKYLNIAKAKGFVNLSPKEREGIHECQRALGIELTDFETGERSARQIAADAQTTFTDIVKNAETYKDRLAAVQKMSDVTTLQLFVDFDKSEQVREAAMEQIQKLNLAKVPGA